MSKTDIEKEIWNILFTQLANLPALYDLFTIGKDKKFYGEYMNVYHGCVKELTDFCDKKSKAR